MLSTIPISSLLPWGLSEASLLAGALLVGLAVVFNVVARWAGRGEATARLLAALALSVAVAVIVVSFSEGMEVEPLAAHVGAAIAVAWMLAALGISLAAGATSGWVRAAEFMALVGAIVAAVALCFEIESMLLVRVLHPYEWYSRIPASADGILDLAAIVAAIGLWRWRSKSGLQVLSLFGVVAMAVVWGGLMIPPDLQIVATAWPAWLPWTLWIQFGLAVQVLAFVWTGEILHRRRWAHPWPGQLEALIQQRPRRPGLRQAIGIVSMTVLVLGVFHILIVPVHFRTAATITFASAVAVSCATFQLAHVDWSVNLGLVGVATATLAGAAFGLIIYPVDTSRELSGQTPILLNTVLIGVIFMAWLWHWLPSVWRQQLHENRPWTTSGRLLPEALRAGYYIGALAVMLSLLMSIWPHLGLYVLTRDDAPGRWVAGLVTNTMLIGVLAWSARSAGKTTVAWLTLLAVVVGGAFVVARLPYGGAGSAAMTYWPLAAGLVGVPVWLLGRSLAASSWSVFAGPLVAIALALPVIGLAGGVGLSSDPWMVATVSAAWVATLVCHWAFGSSTHLCDRR
ncbi:MAG TPA: hypothetical protein VMZ31_18790 [Phycisphaerae bacterium]|nr:hypothetical protein [Phycisphaerae bacterium]